MSSAASAPQTSTGPRTPEGKAVSSQNALKHGLASGTLIIEGENPADYEARLNAFLTDFQPATEIETALVHEISKALWLKDRALRFQAIAFNITMPHLENMAAPMDLPVLLRYQMAHERTFYRALKILQTMQKERKSTPQEFVSQSRPSTPDEIIMALASEMENLTAEIAEFGKQHPGYPGLIKSVDTRGKTTFRPAP